MNDRPDDVGKPELLADLLDRLAEAKLEADLHAIDAATRTYAQKKAGKLPWTRFVAPELRDAA